MTQRDDVLSGFQRRREQQAFARVAHHLNCILGLFTPGRKIAVVVWVDGEPDEDFLLMHPDATARQVRDVLTRRIEDPNTRTGRA